MIYTGDTNQDAINLAYYINDYTKELKVTNIQIDPNALFNVCYDMVQQFPHVDGLEKASAFKKLGNFVAHFVARAPIKSSLPVIIKGIQNPNPNAVLALEVALFCLQNSKIIQSDGAELVIENDLYLSDHSYGDIIDALSEDICPKHHYKLITVLLEQIVYKTNQHCEYKPDSTEESSTPRAGGYYEKSMFLTPEEYQEAEEKWGDDIVQGN